MSEIVLRLIYFVLILGTIATDAFGDASIDKTHHRNHIVELSMVISFFGIIFMMWYFPIEPGILGFTYLFGRIALFNLIYNKTRGLKSTYVGTTDGIFDKIVHKLENSKILNKMFRQHFGANLIITIVTFLSFVGMLISILWNINQY